MSVSSQNGFFLLLSNKDQHLIVLLGTNIGWKLVLNDCALQYWQALLIPIYHLMLSYILNQRYFYCWYQCSFVDYRHCYDYCYKYLLCHEQNVLKLMPIVNKKFIEMLWFCTFQYSGWPLTSTRVDFNDDLLWMFCAYSKGYNYQDPTDF